MKRFSIWFAAMLVLSGCWNVKSDKVTIKFDPKKGSGTFVRQLNGLTCEEKGKDCGEANFADLEKFKVRYVLQLTGLGTSRVKTGIKIGAMKGVYDAKLSGKYVSLTQLPFWKEVRSRFQEIPGNRMDQVLEFHFDPKGEFKAGSFAFEFISTEPDATLEEVTPAGKMDSGRHSVSWDSLPATGETAVVTIRMKGPAGPP